MRRTAISIAAVGLWLSLTGLSLLPRQPANSVGLDAARMRDTACAARVSPFLDRYNTVSEALGTRAAARVVNLELQPSARITANHKNALPQSGRRISARFVGGQRGLARNGNPVQLAFSGAKSASNSAVYLPAGYVDAPPIEMSGAGRTAVVH